MMRLCAYGEQVGGRQVPIAIGSNKLVAHEVNSVFRIGTVSLPHP